VVCGVWKNREVRTMPTRVVAIGDSTLRDHRVSRPCSGARCCKTLGSTPDIAIADDPPEVLEDYRDSIGTAAAASKQDHSVR